MNWLPWAPLGAAMLHIFEEFVYPGGFPAWYRNYRSDPSRITARFLFVVNAALLVACGNIALLGSLTLGVAYWLMIAAVMCSNGCWHVWASYKSRGYSPGVATGVIIYVPLAVYGYSHFVRSGAASIGMALVAGGVGGSYHIWSALFHGRSRT
jgi:hypothetical protein